MRVYLPVSADSLAALVAARELAGPLAGHGVTAALVAAWPDADPEEAEYAALMAAAAASRSAGSAGARRVLAADVPEVVELEDAEDPTRVEVPGLRWRQVVAAHVDLTTDAGDDDDLAWFATQEIPGLIPR